MMAKGLELCQGIKLEVREDMECSRLISECNYIQLWGICYEFWVDVRCDLLKRWSKVSGVSLS
mgnify:CR=1 FL=1